MDLEKVRERFLKAYANIPEPLRDQIIVVLGGKTYTWNASYFEVKRNSILSKKILNTLLTMRII